MADPIGILGASEWKFTPDSVFSRNLCVMKFSPFSGFCLREVPETSVTTLDPHAMLQVSVFTRNDAF